MSKKFKDIPLSDRPREKIIAKGSANLSSEELLALLLGSGTQKINVIALAKKIIKVFPFNKESLPQYTDLLDLPGIGPSKAALILALYELVYRWSTPKLVQHIKTPEDVVCHAEHIRAKYQEHVMVLYLNARSQLIDKYIVAIGTLNHIRLEARDIFSPAFLKPCSGIIIVHNHPSNDCEPSVDDQKFTDRMIKASKLLGIEILDHIIVSKDYYYSFREHNLINS